MSYIVIGVDFGKTVIHPMGVANTSNASSIDLAHGTAPAAVRAFHESAANLRR
jgi:hypothetical protein